MNRRNLLVAAALATTLAAFPAAAQVKPNATTADVGTYAGADRHEKLVEGAKKEGQLDIYTSAQSDDMGALVQAFEKKYGIKDWKAYAGEFDESTIAEIKASADVSNN